MIPGDKTPDGDHAICRGYFDVAKRHTLLKQPRWAKDLDFPCTVRA